jgi:hypothetical protein
LGSQNFAERKAIDPGDLEIQHYEVAESSAKSAQGRRCVMGRYGAITIGLKNRPQPLLRAFICGNN